MLEKQNAKTASLPPVFPIRLSPNRFGILRSPQAAGRFASRAKEELCRAIENSAVGPQKTGPQMTTRGLPGGPRGLPCSH